MTLTTLLADLVRLEVQVVVDGDALRLKAARGVMSETLRDRVGQHKAELLTVLEPGSPTSTTGDPGAAGDQVRRQLEADFADHPDVDRILGQFDRRRLVSLPAQYRRAWPRYTDDDSAWQAGWEVRLQYGAWP